MSTDLTLQRRDTDLTAADIGRALEAISHGREVKAFLTDRNRAIAFRVALPANDEEHARIGVQLTKTTLRGSARGRGSALLSWCFSALAKELGATLDDPQGDAAKASYEAALEVIREHEQEVLEDRAQDGDATAPSSTDEEGEALLGFLRWLVKEEKLALADEDDLGELAALSPLATKPADLYEALIDAPEVDDIFVSEAEFVVALRKYRDAHR